MRNSGPMRLHVPRVSLAGVMLALVVILLVSSACQKSNGDTVDGDITRITLSGFDPGESQTATVTIKNTGATRTHFRLAVAQKPPAWSADDQCGDFLGTTCEIQNVRTGSRGSGNYVIKAPIVGGKSTITWSLLAAQSCKLTGCDWSNQVDTKDVEVSVSLPSLYNPPSTPSELRHMAEFYAPVIFQNVDDSLPLADYLTKWDYDGDQDPTNNWNNLKANSADLKAQVYYWVLETENHWYIGYGFFHPRDWGGTPPEIIVECTSDTEALPRLCHENDMEGMLLTVQKLPEKPYGAFLTMETVSHSDYLSFKDYDAGPSSQVSEHFPLCDLALGAGFNCDVQFLPGTSRPYVYLERKGHAVDGAERWEEEGFEGGDGIIYYPTGHAEQPSGGQDLSVGYQLINIGTLWDLRDSPTIFTGPPDGIASGFLGNEGTVNAAKPPWGWTDVNDSAGAEPGVLFLDPAKWISGVHNGLVPWPVVYIARSYAD